MSIASKDIIDLYEIYQNIHEGPNNPPKVNRDEQTTKKVKCKDGSMAVDCTAADAEWEKQQKNKSQNNQSTSGTTDLDTSTVDTNNNKTDNKTDKTDNKTDKTDIKTDKTDNKTDKTDNNNSNGARVDGGINSSKESIKDIEDKLLEKERLRKAEEEKKRQEETQRAREKLEKRNKEK